MMTKLKLLILVQASQQQFEFGSIFFNLIMEQMIKLLSNLFEKTKLVSDGLGF